MEGNKNITGRKIAPRKYIELYGLFGNFDLPSKSIKVKYFSTIASGRDKGSDSFALLNELKPMRERVMASEIKDLASLLQRNLDDFRVAYELIPYLLNEQPNISFFPAVLGVLIPNNFLTEEQKVPYPKREVLENGEENTIFSFEDKWKAEFFNIGGQTSNLGILSIDIKDIEIVVLDGQHRANAFRVASGAFSEKDSTVYPAFYKDIVNDEVLTADLPITLIWFESEQDELDPRYISRKLFVDVNNTAKKVSKSRKILLNDSEVPALITRFFYSAIAKEKSFNFSDFSLLHSEFDKDSDITVSSDNVFAVTNPEFIYDVYSWLTLGSRAFHALHQYRSRDNFRGNVVKFGEIFNSDEFNEKDINPFEETLVSKIVILKDSSKRTSFEVEFLKKLHTPVYYLYNNFILYRNHYNATAEIGEWYEDGMNTSQRAVWQEVFCGGEGLYYTFKNKDRSKTKINASLKNYLLSIDEIEKEFRKRRAKLIEDTTEREVNAAYDSANTKAFQVGFIMALDLYKEDSSLLDKYEEFVGLVNNIGAKSWIIILNEIRPALIVGTDPKQWPSYQKLILRAIQRDSQYYSKDNFQDSPDGRIFKENILKSFNSWWDSQDEIDEYDLSINSIGINVINKWSSNAKKTIDDLFNKANINPIEDVDIKSLGLKLIEIEVDRINPRE